MNPNENQNAYTGGEQSSRQVPPPHAPQQGGYGPQPGPNRPTRPYKPDNRLILAIVSTIFGCMPLGIVAIVYAAKVDNLYYQGEYDAAWKAAENAKKWSIISLICTAAIAGLWILLVILVTAGALASLPTLL